MIATEQVTIYFRSRGEPDEYGNISVTYEDKPYLNGVKWKTVNTVNWGNVNGVTWDTLLGEIVWDDISRLNWENANATNWGWDPRPDHRETTPTGWMNVPDVVVSPTNTTSKPHEGDHRDGVSVSFRLALPADFDYDLHGAMIEIRGKLYDVIGDPQRYTPDDLPDYGQWPWNLKVEVCRHDG